SLGGHRRRRGPGPGRERPGHLAARRRRRNGRSGPVCGLGPTATRWGRRDAGSRPSAARRRVGPADPAGGDPRSAAAEPRRAPGPVGFGDVRGLSRRAAGALAAAGARSGRLEIVSRKRSAADGFVKYLFRLSDGAYVEAVRIPLPAGPDTIPEKYTLCISS